MVEKVLVRRDIPGLIDDEFWTRANNLGFNISLLCLCCINGQIVKYNFTCKARVNVTEVAEKENSSGPNTPLTDICPRFKVNKKEIAPSGIMLR
jgi:hypothetical protein